MGRWWSACQLPGDYPSTAIYHGDLRNSYILRFDFVSSCKNMLCRCIDYNKGDIDDEHIEDLYITIKLLNKHQ